MKRQFLLVLLVWLGVCFLGALPYYFSGFFHGFTNALFESVSGFTTTGATVSTDIEALPQWLLLWRSITQWLGGMGIVVLMIRPVARRIWLLYVAFTIIMFSLLVIFDMNWFDAVTHSFSTISTGGFSIRNNNAAFYNSPAIEWVCTAFMFLAGFSFTLIWMLLRGKVGNVIRNSEARAYTGIVLIAGIIITAVILRQSIPLGIAARQAFFHVTSLISTSGFYTVDYNLWPSAAQGVLFLLLFIGGCSGSAAGGIKVIRYVILSKQTWSEMRRIVHPRAVFSIQLDGKSGKKKAVYGVTGFVFLYFLTLFFAAMLVSASGADIFTSFNTALVCQGNIGLGLGDFRLFSSFPDYVKWGLCLVMIAGRLELSAVLVLFTVDFWRR
jgi:trk system potassium uptake protein TrkH